MSDYIRINNEVINIKGPRWDELKKAILEQPSWVYDGKGKFIVNLDLPHEKPNPMVDFDLDEF